MKNIQDDHPALTATYECPNCKSRKTSKHLFRETREKVKLRVTCLDCDNSDTFLYSAGGQRIGHPWEVAESQ